MGCEERGRMGGMTGAAKTAKAAGATHVRSAAAAAGVVFAIYWRSEYQEHWTHELTLGDPAEAEVRRCALLGRFRGRHRIDRTTLIEYPHDAEVKVFVPVGREHQAVRKPAEALVAEARRT